MKKTRDSKLRFSIVTSAVVFLIVVGVVLSIRMFSNYSALVLKNTDNQLISLARSVDLSAESQLARYTENLIHTMEHEECKNAEKAWLANGAAQ